MSDVDFLFAFFQNCYVLKDWLVNDDVIGKSDLEQFIKNSPVMRKCQDACNGTKHGQLRGDTSRYPSIRREWSSSEQKSKYCLIIDFEKDDAVALARECISEWDQFLKLRKLL
ncbi:MAG: hypothetical protein P4L53_06760 [Candidatus Obscuribacterales bacterium]|nr:hypothetical protein [Candidatus Obscuribacterales bacterium]